MLRKIRIGISLTIFLLLTFYLVDFAGILPNSFHVLAHYATYSGVVGFKSRDIVVSAGINVVDRKVILLCYLPFGNIPRYSYLDFPQTR